MFNKSLQTGWFSNNIKMAKVVPIYKGDDKTLVNIDRPSSVLPVFSKILEQIIFTRKSNFLVQNNNIIIFMQIYIAHTIKFLAYNS